MGTTTELHGSDHDSAAIEGLEDLLERWKDSTDGERVRLGELLDASDGRSQGPILLVPSLIAISPIGGIPGMSLATGALIFLVAAQLLVRSEQHPWLPQRILHFSFSRSKLCKGVDWLQPKVAKVDKLLKSRWRFLVTGAGSKAIAIACMLLAASFYPLALLPMAVALPAAACLLFSLALTLEDGLLAALGWLLSLAAAGFVVYATQSML